MTPEVEEALVVWWGAEQARRARGWSALLGEPRKQEFAETEQAEAKARDALFDAIESAHPKILALPRYPVANG